MAYNISFNDLCCVCELSLLLNYVYAEVFSLQAVIFYFRYTQFVYLYVYFCCCCCFVGVLELSLTLCKFYVVFGRNVGT